VILCVFALLLSSFSVAATDPHDSVPPTTTSAPHFSWVDVYIDPSAQPLAAYQLELTASGAGVTLVGVEGGEHPAYAEPPYYDPKANLQNRIVIAAFNTATIFPASGRAWRG
jgi:hypothetical protein